MIERTNKFCKLPEEVIQTCVEMFNNGQSVTKIAEHFGINRQNLSKRLKERGCNVFQHNNKKQVNSHFFDELNAESAYWLGYIFTDGYLSNKDNLEICSKDKEQIEKFKAHIQSDHKIGVKTIKGKNYYRINIKDKQIASALRE